LVKDSPIRFLSGSLQLEGVYYTADNASPTAAVVVCHPHPQYGGDMYNLVVTVIVRAAIEAAMGALAFNFRGVGESEGASGDGAGEREDVRAALAEAGSLPGIERVLLAGYSFGAGVAAAAVDATVPALALVALPPGMLRDENGALKTYSGPVLMVSGDVDNISPEGALRQLAASLPSTPEVTIIPGADHFWWGQERALADTLKAFFEKHK
jgi:alpha/beta superfamily hydrolase